MERRSITISNEDIVHVLSSYSWRTGYLVSGTGYISDAILFSLTSQDHRRYQGFRRIERIIGHFEPTNPNGLNENGRIHVRLASVEQVVENARASSFLSKDESRLSIDIESP